MRVGTVGVVAVAAFSAAFVFGAVPVAPDHTGLAGASAGPVDPPLEPPVDPTLDTVELEHPARVSRRATRGPATQLTDPPQPPAGGTTGARVIHLTFDDGPSAYTPAVLDLLRRYDARGTFFVLGNQVRSRAGLVARAATDGHAIANHTWSHPRLAGIGSGAFWQQIGWTQAAVAEVTGRAPTCMRPPYGSMDRNTVPWAAQFGLRVVMWDVDPQDWRTPGASAIAARVVNNARPGAVVLLHDGGGSRQQTVHALGSILSQLSAQGYRFEPVPGC